MKIDNGKLNLILARKCLSLTDLRGKGFSPQTLTKIHKGEKITTKTFGRIAKTLGVDPTEILKGDDE